MGNEVFANYKIIVCQFLKLQGGLEILLQFYSFLITCKCTFGAIKVSFYLTFSLNMVINFKLHENDIKTYFIIIFMPFNDKRNDISFPQSVFLLANVLLVPIKLFFTLNYLKLQENDIKTYFIIIFMPFNDKINDISFHESVFFTCKCTFGAIKVIFYIKLF